MLFNTLNFAIFFFIVFSLYWFLLNKKITNQNILIVISSYIFYGWWDWRFLSLIIFSTVVDFTVGLKLKKENQPIKRKILLWISIIVNIGILGFFKYYNFFLDNILSVTTFCGIQLRLDTLNIILPVGISFYTFQTLSYSIDVYRKKIEATSDYISFSAFVAFFPQLVAGPIERASHLLPQFQVKRRFSYSKSINGLRQILWGLFKKSVIADNCAEYADMIFNNYSDYNGLTLILGAVLFSFQIYGDFSGYSDIAIGVSRLFGFDLMKNFAFPYFSRDIAEFWRRWHISLSTWFRDYLYIPLGGSQGGLNKKIRNTFIIFIVSGFWHGANWTFIVWGLLNAVYFIPLLLLNKNRNHLNIVAENSLIPSFIDSIKILTTYGLTVFAWIFFRAESINHAFQYIQNIFIKGLWVKPDIFPHDVFLLIILFIAVEWIGRKNNFALEDLEKNLSKNYRYLIYYSILFAIFWFSGNEQEFIYFQF